MGHSKAVVRLAGVQLPPEPASASLARFASNGMMRTIIAVDSKHPERLAAGNCSDDNKRLLSQRDCVGQWSVRRFVRQILLAGKEA